MAPGRCTTSSERGTGSGAQGHSPLQVRTVGALTPGRGSKVTAVPSPGATGQAFTDGHHQRQPLHGDWMSALGAEQVWGLGLRGPSGHGVPGPWCPRAALRGTVGMGSPDCTIPAASDPAVRQLSTPVSGNTWLWLWLSGDAQNCSLGPQREREAVVLRAAQARASEALSSVRLEQGSQVGGSHTVVFSGAVLSSNRSGFHSFRTPALPESSQPFPAVNLGRAGQGSSTRGGAGHPPAESWARQLCG